MTARIATITGVRRHGDTLTIVTVQDGADMHEVVANLQDDGTPRWEEGETVVYVAEGSIVPEDVLRARGYWNAAKSVGLLEGKRGNRVKMRRFAGFESRGLLFKTVLTEKGEMMPSGMFIDRPMLMDGGWSNSVIPVAIGDDVSAFLGITEHAA